MISFLSFNNTSRLLLLLSVFYASYEICRSHLRITLPMAMGSSIVYSIVCMPLAEALSDYTGLYDNRILLPFFAIYFVVFYFAGDLPFVRTLVIFLWALILMYFSSIIASLADTAIHEHEQYMAFEPHTLTIQLALTLILCFYIKKIVLSWDANILSVDFTPETLWIGWLSVPILFQGLQTALLPREYIYLNYYSMSGTYLFFAVSLFILYLYLTSIFQSHMSEYVAIQQYKEAQRISEIQNIQYRNLQTQIEADRHARHDFKHTLNLLSQLAATGDNQAIRDYIRKYAAENMNTIVKNYSDNAAINAVLNYYEQKAVSLGITTTLQVDLSSPIPLTDPEFASLIGNIMENAIDACDRTIGGEKKFSFSIRIQNQSTLYIVSSNTYDGELIEDSTGKNTSFSSKKENHHGVGLSSIRQTVDKYDGTLRIEAKDGEFHLDVAIGFN